MKRFLRTTFLALCTIGIMASTAFAGEWRMDNYGWWYDNGDGTWPHNGWFQDIDGTYYYFDAAGYLLTDTMTPDGYYVDRTGAWTGRSASTALSDGYYTGIYERAVSPYTDIISVDLRGNELHVFGNPNYSNISPEYAVGAKIGTTEYVFHVNENTQYQINIRQNAVEYAPVSKAYFLSTLQTVNGQHWLIFTVKNGVLQSINMM